MATRRLYIRQDGKWAWELVVDGNVVATDGGHGYADEADARDMVNRIVGGEFAGAEKRIRRWVSTAEQAPKPTVNVPEANGTPEKATATRKAPSKKKTAQKPGSKASTSGQYQAESGGDEVTVPKGHRLPPGHRKGEQWVNVDPTKNKSGHQAVEKSPASDKTAAPKKKAPSSRNGKTSSRVARGGSFTSADVRAWARRNGYDVADRGTIPKHISAAYHAAHQS